MAEKVVSVVLKAKVDGFVSGFKVAQKAANDLTASQQKMSKHDAFSKVADKAAIAGLGVATAVGVAVKRFADFDQAMSAVKANTGATGAELDTLRQAAIKMGADSIFSAKEAADGINELGKAGISTADIMGGGLKGALDLAAAGQIGVAEAAETTASALTQFNLGGDQAVHVADLLTNGANKAQGGVGDMGAALKQVGLVANATGLTIDETTAGLTSFAAAGLIGSDAGTSFKSMLQRMTPQTEAQSKAMEELGLKFYDSQGNFVGLEGVAGQLQTAMSGLTAEQRNSAMQTIFGSDAVRAATVLYNEGSAGIASWTDKVTEQGAAAKQAATLTDNLKGDIERLGGALDSVLISSGSGANGGLRTLTQGLTGLVEQIGKVPGPVLLAGTSLAALALLGPKGVMAYRNYTKTLDTLGLSMEKIAARGPRAAKGVDLATKAAKGFAVAAAAAAVTYAVFDDNISGIGTERLTKGLLDGSNAVDSFNKKLAANSALSGRFDSGIEDFGSVLKSAFDPSTMESVDRGLGTIKGFFGGTDVSNIAIANQRLSELDAALSGMVSSGAAPQAASAFQQLATAAAAQGVSVDELKQKLPQYSEALDGASNAAKLAGTNTGVMQGATEDLETSAEDAKKALDDLKNAIEGLGSPVAQQRAATNTYESAIDTATESLIEQKDALIKSRLESQGITNATKAQTASAAAWATAQMKKTDLLNADTEAGRTNRANLDAIRTATLEKVTADYALTESTKGTEEATRVATATMQAGRTAFINAAIAAGSTKAEAEALATQLGLIPEQVAIQVKQNGAAGAGAEIDAAARDRNATIWVNLQPGRRMTDLASEWQGVGGRAAGGPGGPVRGPGTGTSDTAGLYALSNNEHVLTAAEVKAAGGHAGIFALRKAILAGGLQGRAAGGPALAQQSRFAQPSFSRSAPPSISETTNAPIHIANVNTTNWEDMERQAESRRRLDNLGRRRAS